MLIKNVFALYCSCCSLFIICTEKKPLSFYDLHVFLNAWYPTTVAYEQSARDRIIVFLTKYFYFNYYLRMIAYFPRSRTGVSRVDLPDASAS